MLCYADYLLVISPPEDIKRLIDKYKRASANVIGGFEDMHNPGLLVLTQQTRCKPFLVKSAIDRWEKGLNTIAPLELQISGFNYFNHGTTSKTIYAAIKCTPQTNNWFKLIRQQLGIRITHFAPHITIARNIPATAFNKLWPNFKNREFSATFYAESLLILQRDTFAEHPQWQFYKEIFFKNALKAAF